MIDYSTIEARIDAIYRGRPCSDLPRRSVCNSVKGEGALMFDTHSIAWCRATAQVYAGPLRVSPAVPVRVRWDRGIISDRELAIPISGQGNGAEIRFYLGDIHFLLAIPLWPPNVICGNTAHLGGGRITERRL